MNKPGLIKLNRYYQNDLLCLGYISYLGRLVCFTLEDPTRTEKIKGKTAIPAGVYPLTIRRELTPKTKNYRMKYDWFEYFIEIDNIPNYDYVYFHIGNYPKDTDGCILLGKAVEKYGKEIAILSSTVATKEFYGFFYERIKNGEIKYIEISNHCEIKPINN